MANTTELKTRIEPFVREELSKWYPGHIFNEKPLPLLKKNDGTYAVHNFDAVSEDNSIVASIKSHSWLTSGGNHPAGKVGKIYQSLYFLGMVQAKVKLLVLTDNETFQGFLKECEGKVAKDITIKLIQLSPDLQSLVRKIKELSSREMSKG